MLAILTTHPIQYQVPIWRALAGRGEIPFIVLFMSEQGLKSRFDPGFGRAVAWDIDLLGGYPNEFLDVRTGDRQDRFDWLRLKPGFGKMLKERGVTVLWVQGWQVMAYWQAIREASKAGIEVWLRGESNLRSNAGGLKQSLKRLLLRRLLNRVDRFLTIGKANREFYRRLGYRDEAMAWAPYCVENKRFAELAGPARAQRAGIRAQWSIPEDAFCFLFVGKFVEKKRPLDLVKAVEQLQADVPARKLHLLWVGTGDLDDALHAACATGCDATRPLRDPEPDEIKPAASFVGFLNQSEIVRAYVAADALVLPSDGKETWGLVVNEAMASGLPCVVSAACGCSEDLVQPMRPDLCFPVGDIEAMARSLAAVIADPPGGMQLAAQIERYDPARTVESVMQLYLQRASRTGRAA